jgi:hypothetical protein
VVRKLSLRATWTRDTRILGFDQDRASRCLDRLPEACGETLVPAAPRCRLVWNRLEIKLLAEVRAVIEEVDECCFVLPPVEFFQNKHPKEGFHLVSCRALITVVSVEPEVGQWVFTYKVFHRPVIVVFEPSLPNRSDILLKRIE